MTFYFDQFESRQPPAPVPYSAARELLWQLLAVVSLVLGGTYIIWRWRHSLNPAALWFAVPLLLAETASYIGLVLFFINLWRTRDVPQREPPLSILDCTADGNLPDRPVAVDVFITSYNEDLELVRLSIRDAKGMTYPHPITLKVHLLDDGRRPAARELAAAEGINYLTRTNNIGFKAGNLRNAMEQTGGDFIVICDADTRPFPTLLRDTLGYFRDPQVAWVQTPQWFYDIPEGRSLPEALGGKLGATGRILGRIVERVIGPIRIGEDPFVNAPTMFYDVIQRRRNAFNAAFCCGAGSIHRREAVMEAALKAFSRQILTESEHAARAIKDRNIHAHFVEAYVAQAALETELTPYKFHVSEDIYTSIILHADPERRWKSVYHPKIESKMLSPQDLETWMIQRFKYAGGTIDIAINDSPLFIRGLSLGQRLMYGTTIWSYFACLWNLMFLVAPIIYLFTGISPVSAYNREFFERLTPFLICNELAMIVGTWGVAGFKGKANYLAFFPVNFRALWTVLQGEKIKFPTTPKERQVGSFFHHVYPQTAIATLTAAGMLVATILYLTGVRGNLSGLLTNVFWGFSNIGAMLGMILAAFWRPDAETGSEPAAHSPASLA